MRRHVFLGLLVFFSAGLLWAQGEARSLLVEAKGRHGLLTGELPVITGHDGAGYVSLDRLARVLGVTPTWGARSRTASFRVEPKTVRLARDRAWALVGGRLVRLAAAPRVRSGDWLVPEEFLTGVLPQLYGSVRVVEAADTRSRSPSRRATLADLRLRSYPSFTRVVLEGSKTFAFQVEEERDVVRARLKGLALRVPRVEGVEDGLVRDVRLNRAGRDVALEIRLEGGRGAVKVLALEDPYRLVLDIERARVTVADLRFRSYPSFTRVVLEASDTFAFRVEEGEGVVRARLRGLSIPASRTEAVEDGLVREVRLRPAGRQAQLEIRLEGVRSGVHSMALKEPHRLVLDIRRPSRETGAVGSAPEPLRRIVLDAGHGGHDSGAVGPGGLREKDVVLDVTRRVARLLEGESGVDVALTRKGDHFVPLQARTRFANQLRAQLFVSIHANAHRHSGFRGVETYFLSSEASDDEARQVAALENGVIRLEAGPARVKRDLLKTILWDLAQSEFQEESSRLAETVQDALTQGLGLRNRGVKQAGFYVLGGAAMPAILVEIGFLTNKRDARQLRDPHYRERIARAIHAGVLEYKRQYDRKMQPARTAEAPR